MNTLLYVVSALTVMFTVLAIPVALAFAVHSRTEYDHGPDCWFCHPRLPRIRR
ncbi:hypothetical protein ACFXKG_30715 [Streptomyces sp. NPDC059255]|uniref:hypothetical protein n=1 Tax=Streptomyces sp. NPDC059255 TaxID=3346793 RepID=UPI00369672C0